MRFNMNNKVRVRLTDEGRRIHRRNHDTLRTLMPEAAAEAFAYQPKKEDSDGWSSWQGWELMREFGPWMRMGHPPPFDLEIDIPEAEK